MRLYPRPYRDDNDLAAVRAVLVAGRRAMDAGQPGYYVHVGDVNWWLFYLNQDEDPFGSLTLWEDSAGAVAGWSLVSPHYRALDVFLRPEWRATPAHAEAWAWTEARLHQSLTDRGQAEGPLRTLWVGDDDDALAGLLAARGYRPHPTSLIWGLERALDGPLPLPCPPEGFSLRLVAGEAEARPRALAGHAAFASRLPVDAYVERYRRFMRASAYAEALDLAAFPPTPAGTPPDTVAAFAIAWTDAVNGVALFEPVGTHPRYQRQGLARAVLLEALSRLRAAGVRRAAVGVDSDNPTAQRLYESVGFEPVRKLLMYERPDTKELTP